MNSRCRIPKKHLFFMIFTLVCIVSGFPTFFIIYSILSNLFLFYEKPLWYLSLIGLAVFTLTVQLVMAIKEYKGKESVKIYLEKYKLGYILVTINLFVIIYTLTLMPKTLAMKYLATFIIAPPLMIAFLLFYHCARPGKRLQALGDALKSYHRITSILVSLDIYVIILRCLFQDRVPETVIVILSIILTFATILYVKINVWRELRLGIMYPILASFSYAYVYTIINFIVLQSTHILTPQNVQILLSIPTNNIGFMVVILLAPILDLPLSAYYYATKRSNNQKENTGNPAS